MKNVVSLYFGSAHDVFCVVRFCVYAVRFLCNYDAFKLSANSLLTDELSAEAMFSVADKL